MSSTWKNNIEITIFGESHGKGLGIVLGNLPSGIKLDLAAIKKDMKRRAPGQNLLSTPRKETDEFEIISGVLDNITTGAPLMALIKNQDQHSKDYSLLKSHMRPGHSDYPAYIKYHGFNDVRGGGHFSGRITAPIVLAGAIAKQILAEQGIRIQAHLKAIQDITDESFPLTISSELLDALSEQQYPVIKQQVFPEMAKRIDDARRNLDSVGGKIECCIVGLEAGVGDPFFDSMESHLANLLFAIPAIKSVSFGNPDISLLTGQHANDEYYYDHDQVKTKSNNNGGILGGISTGMPVVFTVGVKPTPSIAKKQATIDILKKENSEIEIHGRHDPCIVPRAVVVVEAMAALAILDFKR